MFIFHLSLLSANLLSPSAKHELKETCGPMINLLQHIFGVVDLVIAHFQKRKIDLL